jgi:hypothetical protein
MVDNAGIAPRPARPKLARRTPTVSPAVRLLRPLGIGFALAALGVGGFALYLHWSAATQERATQVTTEMIRTPYKTEEDWLLTSIVGDLSDMVALAGKGTPPKQHAKVTVQRDQSGQVSVTVQGVGRSALREPLLLQHSTWAPRDYEPLVSHEMAAVGLTAPPADTASGEGLLGRLLDLRAEVIQQENDTLSAALQAHPADPKLHEDAALLLGAFALREAAGVFTDTRQVLCRMTAHLAFARGLRATRPAGLSGRYAELFLATLAERGAEAERALNEVGTQAAEPVQQAWQRVIRLRLTDDWRLVATPKSASLAERLAWLRALDRTLGSPRQLEMLQHAQAGPGPEPDWVWIVTREPSVEIGNALLGYALNATLGEAEQVWVRAHGKPLPSGERVNALNLGAQPFISHEGLRVIAWGTWAAMYQRHLLHVLDQTQYHYRQALGLKEDAERYVADTTKAYAKLTFFPVVAACWEAEKEKPVPAILDAAVTFTVQYPELVTMPHWWGLEGKAVKQGLHRRLPARATWFSTGCVRGTTFDVANRRDAVPALTPFDRLKAISPRSYAVVSRALLASTSPPSLAEAQAAFGERTQYDERAITFLVNRVYIEDPATELRLRRQVCEMDPGGCVRLGARCIEARDERCAVAAYEKAIREATDRVMVANSTDWVVTYYLRTGNIRRAREIAEMSAEVGSFGGMLQMALFLEGTGRYADAEKRIIAARQRYPKKGPYNVLIGFYHRMAHVRKVASYEGRFVEQTKDILPKGLERADLASQTAPPTDGVQFTEETPTLRRNRLHKGDVVVAVDGWRVRTQEQYYVVRDFDTNPDFRLILWRGNKYEEVAARCLYRRFGTDLATYRSNAK